MKRQVGLSCQLMEKTTALDQEEDFSNGSVNSVGSDDDGTRSIFQVIFT
jgi:hypothetical protein